MEADGGGRNKTTAKGDIRGFFKFTAMVDDRKRMRGWKFNRRGQFKERLF
jgi:hypothetical protein